MAEDTKDQIEQRLAELPDDVREAVLSAELGNHVRTIGQAHGLHIDQIGKLEDETMLVMLGFFEPNQFNTQLEQQLLIPAADAATLAAEISEQVFAPIRASLEGFMRTKRSETPDVRMPSSVSAPAVTEIPPTPIAITKIDSPAPAITPSVSQVPTPPIQPISQPAPVAPVIPPPVSISTPPSMPSPAPIPVVPPITAPSMPAAEKMLTEKTAAIAPTPAPTPHGDTSVKPIYKTDPYREPIE